VAIGGGQTGVYPRETPGGWNLIGRTSLRLFDPGRDEPAILRAGDQVKFHSIPPEEFELPLAGEATVAPTVGTGIEIVRAGMYTTVQDLGRRGHRAAGVAVAGAVDALAARLANLIVGNPEQAAGLEVTLVGPEIRFARDTVVALGGAEFEGLPAWRPVAVKAGSTLQLGAVRHGCRGFLAIAGGVPVPEVLGSRSTQVRAGFGGWHGRVLRSGDNLPLAEATRAVRGTWRLDPRLLPAYSPAPVVRIMPGAQAGEFSARWEDLQFTVRPQSDRMGVRLAGPPLQRSTAADLVSAPVSPGTIQVPPDGQPIVLLADAQTIGGYPQVAQVISVDLPLVAQVRPGDTVRFRVVTLAEARAAWAAQEQALAILRAGLKEKWA
jgi:antagonist of KipI